MKETIESILDFNERYVKGILTLNPNFELKPLISYKIGNDVSVVLIASSDGRDFRDDLKSLLDKLAEKRDMEWITLIIEAYMRVVIKKEFKAEDYVRGSLAERFKKGDESVKEIVNIQVYTKSKKIMRVIDKKTLNRVVEGSEDFDGFMTISDVDRVLWRGGNDG